MVLAFALPCGAVVAVKSFPQVKKGLSKLGETYDPVSVKVDASAIPEDLVAPVGSGRFQLCEVFPREELVKVAGRGLKQVSTAKVVEHPEVNGWDSIRDILVQQATCTVRGDIDFRLQITNGDKTNPYWTDSGETLAGFEKYIGPRVSETLWVPNLPGVVVTHGPWRSMLFCGRSTVTAEIVPSGGERSLRQRETQQVRALTRALSEAVCGTLSQPSRTVLNNPRDVNMVYRLYGGAHPEDIVGVDFMPGLMGQLPVKNAVPPKHSGSARPKVNPEPSSTNSKDK